MSTLGEVRFDCPGCGGPVGGEVGIVLNLSRRPDFRLAVLERRLNTLVCGACGRATRIVRTVGLLDFDRLQWVMCYPEWAEVHWRDLAASTTDSFLRVVGGVPAADRGGSLGAWTVRVVFGPEALRDKYTAWDAGLDDADVEMEKVALIAGSAERLPARIHLRSAGPPREWGIESSGGRVAILESGPLRAPELFNPAELGADAFVSYRRWLVAPRGADPLTFDLDGRLNPFATRDQLRRG